MHRLLNAESIISLGQQTGDPCGVAAFDLVAMEHVHGVAIAKQDDGRRRGRQASGKFAHAFNSGDIAPRKDGCDLLRQN